MHIGHTWSESREHLDPLTGRPVRRLTSAGLINMTPTYHTDSGFTADGEFLVFVSVREGATWVLRAHVATGELTALWRAPGVGDRNYIHRSMEQAGPGWDGRGICGNRLCLAPRSGQTVFTCERALRAVDLRTHEERVLLADCGEEWVFGAPAVDPTEAWVAIALSSAHPQLLAGEAVTRAVTRDYRSYGDHRLRLVRVALDGSGQVETLFEADHAGSAHCAFCPADPDLLYFDLDRAPHYWCGGDGVTPRVWLLHVGSGRAHPLRDEPLFQVHTAWLWDGSALAYHGALPGGGVYIGLTRPDGETIWEGKYPQARAYGHLTPDRTRPALVLDGDFSPDTLQWLYIDKLPAAAPRLEPICRHDTEWGSIQPGSQYTHPHPLADPTGRWLAFNAARDGRQDVHVAAVSP